MFQGYLLIIIGFVLVVWGWSKWWTPPDIGALGGSTTESDNG